jgi:hypothetical protein
MGEIILCLLVVGALLLSRDYQRNTISIPVDDPKSMLFFTHVILVHESNSLV